MNFNVAISTLFLVFVALSSDEILPRMKQQMQKIQAPKLLGALVSHLVEAYLEPENSMKMQMSHMQWSKVKPTGFLNLIPNESSCRVFRDMETNEIRWEDPKDLLRTGFINNFYEAREEIAQILKLNGAAMANGIFKFFHDHSCNIVGIPIVKGFVLLMSENVDVDRKGEKKYSLCQTPLAVATFFDVGKAITKLVDRGANTEELDVYGWTPLQLAAHLGYEESCQALLRSGANVDAHDKRHGDTPLMFASTDVSSDYDKAIRIVEMFLEAGADTTITSHMGQTAYEYATKNLFMGARSLPEWENFKQKCGKIIKTHEEKNRLQNKKFIEE